MPTSERPDPPPQAWVSLLALLPELENPPRPLIRSWSVDAFPHPDYDPFVTRIFEEVGRTGLLDPTYDPADAGRWARDAALVAQADLDQVRAMLTWCMRGERFSSGFWAGIIEDGTVARILIRLVAIHGDRSAGSLS